MKNIYGEWCRGAAPPPAGPEELAGAAAPPGPGPVKLAGAAAPPGAGPEFWPGRGAPPGQTPDPGRHCFFGLEKGGVRYLKSISDFSVVLI